MSRSEVTGLDRLLAVVGEVAEVPRAVRAGAPVTRTAAPAPDLA